MKKTKEKVHRAKKLRQGAKLAEALHKVQRIGERHPQAEIGFLWMKERSYHGFEVEEPCWQQSEGKGWLTNKDHKLIERTGKRIRKTLIPLLPKALAEKLRWNGSELVFEIEEDEQGTAVHGEVWSRLNKVLEEAPEETALRAQLHKLAGETRRNMEEDLKSLYEEVEAKLKALGMYLGPGPNRWSRTVRTDELTEREWEKHPGWTAMVAKDSGQWIGWVREAPGVNAQDGDRKRMLETLRVALREWMESKRTETDGLAPKERRIIALEL